MDATDDSLHPFVTHYRILFAVRCYSRKRPRAVTNIIAIVRAVIVRHVNHRRIKRKDQEVLVAAVAAVAIVTAVAPLATRHTAVKPIRLLMRRRRGVIR
jgi:hypothetical protein